MIDIRVILTAPPRFYAGAFPLIQRRTAGWSRKRAVTGLRLPTEAPADCPSAGFSGRSIATPPSWGDEDIGMDARSCDGLVMAFAYGT